MQWFKALPTEQRRDAVQLAQAETEMLFETIDPSGSCRREEYSTDFRDRYFALQALINIFTIAGESFDKTEFNQLTDRAVAINWLP